VSAGVPFSHWPSPAPAEASMGEGWVIGLFAPISRIFRRLCVFCALSRVNLGCCELSQHQQEPRVAAAGRRKDRRYGGEGG
jgi:hypothetical protein